MKHTHTVLIIIKHTHVSPCWNVELLTKENENVHHDDRWYVCMHAWHGIWTTTKKNYFLNSHNIPCMPYKIFLTSILLEHTHYTYIQRRKDKTSKHQYYNCYVYWNVIKVVKANFLMEISNGTHIHEQFISGVHILDEILLLLYCYSTQVNPYTNPFMYGKEKFYCISVCAYSSTRHNTF